MVLFGYGYFTMLAFVAASGWEVPIRSRQFDIVYGIAVKCGPGVVLCGYALMTLSGWKTYLWLLMLVYHSGSLIFSFVLIVILNRSRYKETQPDSIPIEPRKTRFLRRAYGTGVYLVQLILWYISFGT